MRHSKRSLRPGRRTSRATPLWLVRGAPALLLAALCTGCGTSSTVLQTPQTKTSTAPTSTLTPTATFAPAPTATLPAGPCPNKVLGTATVPPAPAPMPLAPAQWTTYTNNLSHYSVPYPASWYVPDKSPASNDFYLLNFDPNIYHPGGDALPPPPYTKIELNPLQGTEGQTPAAVYAANYTNNPLAAPACSRTATPTTIGGHAALQVVQWPAASGYGPPITYPQVFAYVVIGNGQPLLSLSEFYSPGGRPSATFARMLASLTFTA